LSQWDPAKKAIEDAKIQVAMIGFCGCWGCHLSFLDMDEAILGLLDKVTITRSSFTDLKRIPHHCTIGFIEGGIANDENIEVLSFIYYATYRTKIRCFTYLLWRHFVCQVRVNFYACIRSSSSDAKNLLISVPVTYKFNTTLTENTTITL
jgi:hypothetical protein